MLISVSTLFVVFRFDTGEIKMILIIESPQSLELSFCGEYKHRGVTTNLCWEMVGSSCSGCVCGQIQLPRPY